MADSAQLENDFKPKKPKTKMAKTNKTNKNTKNVNVKATAKVKTTKTAPTVTQTTTNFQRKTIAPNIEQLAPKQYRARKTVNGTRESFMCTSLKAAKAWLKQTRNPKN